MSTMTAERCLQKAVDAFSDLWDDFQSETGKSAPNFWQVGCAFDTMLDYVWLLNYANENHVGNVRPMDQAALAALMTAAKQGYQRGVAANAAVWYDDWTWYGIAGSKAFDPQYMGYFQQGGQLEFFQNVALDMWGLVDHGDYQALLDNTCKGINWDTACDHPQTAGDFVARARYHHGTTHSWDNIVADPQQYAFFTTPGSNWAKPRFSGGAWQYDMYESPLPLPPSPPPGWDGNSTDYPNPAEVPEPFQGPFQMTLMTGLYVVLAQRLAQAAKIKETLNLSPAIAQRLGSPEPYERGVASAFSFIDSWCAVNDGDQSWIQKCADSAGFLFRERVPTYDKYSNHYPAVQGFEPKNFWAGDQGLYLGALITEGRSEQAQALVAGVAEWLTTADNIVLGFSPPTFPDPGDYASGSGIFWRYVLHACRTNPTFREHMVGLVRADPNIVAASAANAENEATGLFNPFNVVAVEAAACYVLNEASKTPGRRSPADPELQVHRQRETETPPAALASDNAKLDALTESVDALASRVQILLWLGGGALAAGLLALVLLLVR